MATSAHLEARIDPDTALGPVRLTVSQLDRSRAFYERAIGLRATELDDGTLALGAPGEPPLLELRGDASAPRLNRRAPGLYHLVSEALYLSDPDGNGIEIYRDRPRAEWPRSGGQLQMSTLRLDLDGVIEELRDAPALQAEVASGTRIGHVHLQVADLAEAEAFYHGVLGFDVMVRGYPGALFVSAGGYHHHVGLNTWHSAGSAPAAPEAVGLRSFTVEVPSERDLAAVLARVEAAGLQTESASGGVLVRDPFGTAVVLTAARPR